MRRNWLRSARTLRTPIDASKIQACFDRSDVLAVYLFGSAARGNAHALSDVDIAFLCADGVAEDKVFDEVYESLQRELGEGNFDLVPLRRAPLHIQFQVATEGTLLLCRDPARAERFAARAIVRYLDFKPYREAYFAREE